MEQVMRVKIPKVYGIYGTPINKSKIQLKENGNRHISYKCGDCGCEFRIDHNWRGYMSGGYNTNLVMCPGCGTVYDCYGTHDYLGWAIPNIPIPHKIELSLCESKNVMKITAKYACYLFNCKGEVEGLKIRESVAFNIKKRKTVYTRYSGACKIKEFEIGNPLESLFVSECLMRHIRGGNCSNKQRSEITEILKRLRDGIRNRFKKIHGINLGRLITKNGGNYNGRVVIQLLYMAYRMLLPDIRQMSSAVNNGMTKLFEDFKILREAPDSVTAIMKVFGIPNIPSYRKIVQEKPYEASSLGAITKNISNPDIACRMFESLSEKYTPYTDTDFDKRINDWLTWWLRNRKPLEILRFIENSGLWLIGDTYRMETQLTNKNRECYNKNVKLGNQGHEWLTKRIYEQNHQDFNLEIPEHIRRRFEMQKDSLKLFMPETHHQMVSAGRQMHNCVGSYAQRVLSGECSIVFVADDKGVLVASVEVREGSIVQAKLKYNEPIKNNIKVAQGVLEWARDINLEIRTDDFEMKDLKKKSA